MPKRLFRDTRQLDLTEWVTGRPAKRHTGYDITLCGRCNDIKLDSIIDEVLMGKIYPQKIVFDLGDQRTWSKSCPLCRLFSYAADRERSSNGPYFVLLLIVRRATDDEDRRVPANIIPELELPFFAVSRKGVMDEWSRINLGAIVYRTGYISWLTDQDGTTVSSRGRLLDNKLADFSLVQKWMAYCHQHHTMLCAVKGSELLRGFQVIDCESNQVILATSQTKYLALSYVWGSDPGDDNAQVGGKLVLDRLPQTIRDAIEITKRLGHQYLWVDRYCIPSDPKMKHAQIMKMDIIYKQAYATVIAVAGNGATYGIPGAGTQHRTEQPCIKIGRHTIFSTLPHSSTLIERSHWMTRGWTYQEAMLSSRKIFFTEDQVHYECRSMQCSESLPPDLEQWHTADKQTFHTFTWREMFQLSTTKLKLIYVWAFIAAYTGRTLSYDDDSLNGILGIMGFLQTPETTLKHFWGMPFTESPEYRKFSKWHPSHCILNRLLWEHVSESRRRKEFPSWSWTGWQGRVQSQVITYAECKCEEKAPRMILGAETSDGNFISWKELQFMLSNKSPHNALPQIMVMQAHTVQLKFRHFAAPDKAIPEPGFYAYTEVDQLRLEYSLLTDCTVYAVVRLDNTESALRDRLEREEFTGVLIGCTDRTERGDTIIMDQRSDGTLERIGTVRLKAANTYGQLKEIYCCGNGSKHTAEWQPKTPFSFPCESYKNIGKRIALQPMKMELECWKIERVRRIVRIA